MVNKEDEKEDCSLELRLPLLNGSSNPVVERNKSEHGDCVGRGVGDVEERGVHGHPKACIDSDSNSSGHTMRASETIHLDRSVVLRHPTSYVETLIHVLKGNIGSGMFAMGEAFKNAGLVLGFCLTVFLGLICIYNNHILISCAEFVQKKKRMDTGTSFSNTVGLCFQNGSPVYQRYEVAVRKIVKGFVIVTQIGFCCVYVVLVSAALAKVMVHFNLDLDPRWYMLMIFLPILISSLITSLKFLAPVSMGSNLCILVAISLTLYVACRNGLPPLSSRPFVADIVNWPLFVGTVIYAFEGIGLILPLQNEMKKPEKFGSTFGVLNVGLAIVMTMFIVVGFTGFLRYGEDVKGSLTLNIPPDNVLGVLVQIVFAIGIGFSYPLQFYVAADIVWDDIDECWGPYKRKLLGKLITRTGLVIFTFLVSAIIPNVGVFISLIGAVCSTSLALVFPALSDLALRTNDNDPYRTKYHHLRIFMDILTLIIAILGFTTGAYCGTLNFVKAFINPTSNH